MNLIEKIKAIETYVCENFEELGLDDPVEEEYFSAYEEIKGASVSVFSIKWERPHSTRSGESISLSAVSSGYDAASAEVPMGM